jgi:hypothetical protein
VIYVETDTDATGCPECGVVAVAHGRRRVAVRDLPVSGRLVVLLWAKRCPDPYCSARWRGIRRERDAHRRRSPGTGFVAVDKLGRSPTDQADTYDNGSNRTGGGEHHSYNQRRGAWLTGDDRGVDIGRVAASASLRTP